MIYLARTHFRMSAREWFHETPEWETDVLIEQFGREQKAIEKAQREARR